MKKYHVFKIDMLSLNVYCILLMALVLGFTYVVFPNSFNGMINLFSNDKFWFIFLPLMIVWFILHELLHALGYIIHGADRKKITFGMELEKGVFYCLCKQDIDKKNILFSLMYPLFFIGIVTYIIGVIFNYHLLTLLSIVNIAGAIGDIMYFIFISRLDKDIMYSELDDGTSFAIRSKSDPNKIKHIGLKYVGVVDNISRSDYQLLYISKLSYLVLVLCVVCIIMWFV